MIRTQQKLPYKTNTNDSEVKGDDRDEKQINSTNKYNYKYSNGDVHMRQLCSFCFLLHWFLVFLSFRCHRNVNLFCVLHLFVL
jgi:hypothetical protein